MGVVYHSGVDDCTRHNNKKTIPIIFHADSAGMSNSEISLAEFQDSSQILGRIPGGE